jgi:hypothetical protein
MHLRIQPTIPPDENATYVVLWPWHVTSVTDPDHPDLQPFIQAFARMMFAHAEFEHRFANLVSVIAREKDDPLFGERPKNQWAVEKRAKELKNFAAERADRHAGGLPEIDEILVYVRQANQLSRDRNLLAHGNHYRTIHGAGGNHSRYQVRRAASLRYCGDDIRFQTRPWTPKQLHHTSRLRDGAPLSGPDFPVVWTRHAQEAA